MRFSAKVIKTFSQTRFNLAVGILIKSELVFPGNHLRTFLL